MYICNIIQFVKTNITSFTHTGDITGILVLDSLPVVRQAFIPKIYQHSTMNILSNFLSIHHLICMGLLCKICLETNYTYVIILYKVSYLLPEVKDVYCSFNYLGHINISSYHIQNLNAFAFIYLHKTTNCNVNCHKK